MVWDRTNRPVWLRCTVAILVAVMAAVIRWQFLGVFELRFAFLTFYPAVAVAALYGGFSAGLLATALSAALADYFWMEPVGQFAISNSADLIGLVVFFASGALISYLAEAAYRAQARAHKAEEQSRLAAERETERKRTENTLRTTVQRFHNILSNIFSGILVVTEDDRIEFANQTFCDQFDIAEAPSDLIGLTAENTLEKVLPAYAHPEANLARIRQTLSQKHRIEDEEVLMHNGRVFLRDYIPILVDGKPVARMWQHRDITERKQMEDELRRSRDELELHVRERTAELVAANEDLRQQAELLNLAHDAIFVRGMDHAVRFWNDGAVELYGFKKEEALGKITHDLLHTGLPESIDQIANQVLESGRWEGELRQTTSTGKEMFVESRWALQRGTDGGPLGFLEINRDITARKLAEEALRSNMERLEQVNAELQEFAFVASHDLQEPLRKIQTFCDLAKKRCAPVLDSAGNEYLDKVLNSASRMRDLLRDLLQFSRVAVNPELFGKIQLNPLARKAADVFEALIKESDCRIEIENLPAIEADESQMLQLFQNLIGNALKFRGADPPHIKVYGKIKRQECEIFVIDNGIGFDQNFAERIFKPFQTLHARNEYKGTGMGLAICRKIVERHGGTIKAESMPGKGSTFIIRLPVKQAGLERISVRQQS